MSGGARVVGLWVVVVALGLGWAGTALAQLPPARAVEGFPDWFLGTVIAVLSAALTIFGGFITWGVARYFASLQEKLKEIDEMKVRLDQIVAALPEIGGVERTLSDHEARIGIVEARCAVQHEKRK